MGVELRLKGVALPCIAQEAIRAGLAVKLTPAVTPASAILSGTADPDPHFQGSNYNIVQGAVLPMADDDVEARYVAAFRVYNETPPLYTGLTDNFADHGYTLREFPEGLDNFPVAVTLEMTVPRLKEDAVIPSGALMLAYDEGIYTVTSGCFVDAAFAVGDALSVMGTGADRGKWYKGAGGKVAIVWEHIHNKSTLTIKTKEFAS